MNYQTQEDILKDKEVREEIQKYLYKNSLTSFFSNWGHKKIRGIKKDYLKQTNKNRLETLDLCCGLGYNCNYLNDFENYIGIDHNENFIIEAQKTYPKYQFINKSILEKDLGLNKKFDVITAIQALEHFSNHDLQIMFDNIIDNLKEDGIFIYIIPLDSSFLINLGRELTTKRYMNSKFKNMDYMKWLKNSEHINEYSSIVKEVKERFNLVKEIFMPINLKIINLNIYSIGVCKLK